MLVEFFISEFLIPYDCDLRLISGLVDYCYHSERLVPSTTDTLGDIVYLISIFSQRCWEVIVLNFIFWDVLYSDVAISFLVVGNEVLNYFLDGL